MRKPVKRRVDVDIPQLIPQKKGKYRQGLTVDQPEGIKAEWARKVDEVKLKFAPLTFKQEPVKFISCDGVGIQSSTVLLCPVEDCDRPIKLSATLGVKRKMCKNPIMKHFQVHLKNLDLNVDTESVSQLEIELAGELSMLSGDNDLVEKYDESLNENYRDEAQSEHEELYFSSSHEDEDEDEDEY